MIESVRPIVGQIDLYPKMRGEGITARDVIVWTPPGYDAAGEQRYPVLYMQDGKNLFGTELERQDVDWHVDETCVELVRQGEIEPPIVVGIFSSKYRPIEYAPGRIGDRYRRFVVERLKPFVDREYHTLADRAHTFAGGSSMGGLVSFMFVWEHTEVFSKAICMSPAFRYDRSGIDYVETVRSCSGAKKDVFLYIDNGGDKLDTRLQPGVDDMLATLEEKGYHRGRDFECVREPDAPHFETAWARRLPVALKLLLGRSR
jgi:predicted alpha/beta superfamily hydrolase